MAGGCYKVAGVMLLLASLSACTGMQEYRPAPLDAGLIFENYQARDLDDPALASFMREQGYAPAEWPMPEWDSDALTLAALYFNPDLNVAEAEWHLQQTGEITASQRVNPVLNLPAGWYVDSPEEDREPWLLGVVIDLVLERPAKRQARIDRARLLTSAARIEVEKTAWRIRSQVHTALAELAAAEDRRASLQQRIDIVTDILSLLQRREELGQVAAYEYSASRLAMQRLRLELSAQESRIQTARGQLAAAIGLPASALEGIGIDLPIMETPPQPDEIPAVDLQGLALQHRYDIRQALAGYAAQEAALRLEIEKQYPDITLSPGFVFDQSDYIWELGAAWILPLFHRHEGQIAEAMAQRRLLQERFLQLQASIINKLHQARTEYFGKLATYREARALKNNAQEYRDQIRGQLEAGYADRLQYLRAAQAVSEASQAVSESHTALLQAYVALENVLQYPLQGRDWSDRVSASLITTRTSAEGEPDS